MVLAVRVVSVRSAVLVFRVLHGKVTITDGRTPATDEGGAKCAVGRVIFLLPSNPVAIVGSP